MRSLRVNILGTSVSAVDLGGTIVVGYVIADRYNLNKPVTIASLLLLGHLTHALLGVKTAFNDGDGELNNMQKIYCCNTNHAQS